MEALAGRFDQPHQQNAQQKQLPINRLVDEKDLGVRSIADNFEELVRAVTELQVLASAPKKVQPT